MADLMSAGIKGVRCKFSVWVYVLTTKTPLFEKDPVVERMGFDTRYFVKDRIYDTHPLFRKF